jgi:hypothetical protein
METVVNSGLSKGGAEHQAHTLNIEKEFIDKKYRKLF